MNLMQNAIDKYAALANKYDAAADKILAQQTRIASLQAECVRLVAALRKIEGVNRSINTHYQWIASEALAACKESVKLFEAQNELEE